MIVDSCQRWRARRDSYRPAGEAFEPRAFEVAAIESDRLARAFVEAHHYSGSRPAAGAGLSERLRNTKPSNDSPPNSPSLRERLGLTLGALVRERIESAEWLKNDS